MSTTEYKLSYTAAEIDEKLGKIDTIEKQVNNLSGGNVGQSKPLKGKKLSIIGDSISTFSGYIPEGYGSWYPKNYVDSVEKTWWHRLLQNTGMVLCKNASWSGSTLCGNSANTSGIVGCSDARVEAASGEDEPDIIIVFIGINDFAKTNGYSCGEYDGSSGVTANATVTSITDAYGLLLSKLRQRYPKAFVYGCRVMPEKYSGGSMNASFSGGFPNVNPDDAVSLSALNERIEKICKAFGCGVIPMDASGISFYNVADCTGDGLHPNEEQMRRMAQVAEKWLYQYVVDSTVSGDGGDSGDSGTTHAHSYTSEVTTAATCETDGVRTYTCSCGNSYTEKVPATGHSYVNGVCTVCGSSDPDSPGVDEHWTPLVYTENGGYYAPSGSLTSYSGVYNTGQVAVGSATKVKFTQTTPSNHYVVFWSDDKTVIHSEKTSTPETYIFDIPAGVAYFAIAYYEAERDTVDIQVYIDNSMPQQEYQWVPLTYTEAGGYYDKNGNFLTHSSVYNTGQIEVGNAIKVKFTQSNTSNHYVVFWDSELGVVGSKQFSTAKTFTISFPVNVAYFSIAYYEAERETVDIQIYVPVNG